MNNFPVSDLQYPLEILITSSHGEQQIMTIHSEAELNRVFECDEQVVTIFNKDHLFLKYSGEGFVPVERVTMAEFF